MCESFYSLQKQNPDSSPKLSCLFGSLEYFHYKIPSKYSVIKIKLHLIVIRLSPEGETPIQKYPVKAL